MSDHQRLLVAITLSLLIVFGWQYFFVPELTPTSSQTEKEGVRLNEAPASSERILNLEEVVSEGFNNHSRIKVENNAVKGSINLVGARIDDLSLERYKATLNKNSPNIVLFSPSSTKDVYFAEFGWVSDEKTIELPDNKTLWSADKAELKANEMVKLEWENKEHIKFILEIHLDNDYMFHVKQKVLNNSDKLITIQPYSLISRANSQETDKNLIIHEGAIGVLNNSLNEISFGDLESSGKVPYDNQMGWVGFTDKYWLAALVPDNDQAFKGNFIGFKDQGARRFQADMILNKLSVKPNAEATSSFKLFAGAKKLELLDKYEAQYNIKLFDRAVDFGWLYFITKPIFLLLSYFYKLIGNFGLAILLLTVVIKLLLFPLAYKGFRGMNRIKDLQPQTEALKQKYKEEPMVFQKAVMELYKREKVNPVAGCLPLLLQMPVFFALYKVLYVSIEMRQAPFFGWIKDLSIPDPLNFFNLFGLIAWNPPEFLHIGILPVIMAMTMYFQQRLSPEPTDPIQAKVMKMLPWVFMFMFASFPSGLIVYWAWSNILSIIQQITIKKMDAKRKIAGNLKIRNR